MKYFWGTKLQKNRSLSCSSKMFSRLAKMTLWLVHASYSLPYRQAVKLTFFARVLRPSSRRRKRKTCITHERRAAFFHSLPLPVACGLRFLFACSAAVLCALGEEDANRTSFILKSSPRAHPLLEISGGSRGASHGIFGVKRKESWESFRSTEACRKFP